MTGFMSSKLLVETTVTEPPEVQYDWLATIGSVANEESVMAVASSSLTDEFWLSLNFSFFVTSSSLT